MISTERHYDTHVRNFPKSLTLIDFARPIKIVFMFVPDRTGVALYQLVLIDVDVMVL